MTDTTTSKVNAAAQLVEQVKSYVLLEKKYLTVDASEKVTKLLSWLLLTLILIGVGLLMFLLLVMTLIHVLESLLGSMTIACAIATVFCLLVFFIIWYSKDTLIVRPVTRKVKNVLGPAPVDPESSEQISQLAQLPDNKDELRESIRLKEKEMKESYNKLIERKPKKDQTLGEKLGVYIDRGLAIYRGAMFSIGFYNVLRGKSPTTPKKGKTKTKK